ncbi:MAG TPA: DUF4412 domain-containing protein [Verrucomicrobiae bacterium]|nr:DUF4412 domain-containing protein [Verrucomicrobiae bacterium]
MTGTFTHPEQLRLRPAFLIAAACLFCASDTVAFEGRIQATLTRGGEAQTWIYSVGTNTTRIERSETNWPYAKNLVTLNTGEVTLLFPHNNSFVQLPPASENAPLPTLPSTPSTSMATSVGPTNLPGVPSRPAMPAMAASGRMMPAMPMMPMATEELELKATGETTNILGVACARYEIKQRGETMEIWATDQLIPFQCWLPNQPPRATPQMIEERWSDLLKTKKLFPLLATLRFEKGPERFRFVVTSIQAQKIQDPDGGLFQIPAAYQEIEPLPF